MATLTGTDFFTFSSAQEKLLALADAFDAALTRVVNANNSDFSEALSKFRSNTSTIILNNTIGEALQTLFEEYELVAENPKDQYLLCVELFDFGDTDTPTIFNQKQLVNNAAINTSVQVDALAVAYNNAAQIDFLNEDELQEVNQVLENQYQKVADDNIDSSTRLAILDLRTSALTYFQSLDLASVIDIETSIISSLLLSYQYYGNSDNADQIIGLNSIQNTGFIEGDVKIVSV